MRIRKITTNPDEDDILNTNSASNSVPKRSPSFLGNQFFNFGGLAGPVSLHDVTNDEFQQSQSESPTLKPKNRSHAFRPGTALRDLENFSKKDEDSTYRDDDCASQTTVKLFHSKKTGKIATCWANQQPQRRAFRAESDEFFQGN